MAKTVKAMQSNNVLRLPALNIFRILNSLKALNAENAPPDSPSYGIIISTRLTKTIMASNLLKGSATNSFTPSPMILGMISTVNMTVKMMLNTTKTFAVSSPIRGYWSVDSRMVLHKIMNMINPLKIGLFTIMKHTYVKRQL